MYFFQVLFLYLFFGLDREEFPIDVFFFTDFPKFQKRSWLLLIFCPKVGGGGGEVGGRGCDEGASEEVGKSCESRCEVLGKNIKPPEATPKAPKLEKI